MPMESNIATSPGSFANEATRLLQEVRKMMHIWMMNEMAKKGAAGTAPEPCPCLVPVVIDPEATTDQMTIVSDSVIAIKLSVDSVNTQLVSFHTQLTSLAIKAKDASYQWSHDDHCWDCDDIAAFRLPIERAVCNLSTQVAALQVAVQAVFRGFYLLACCPPDPCGEGVAYPLSGRGASPPSTQTPTAKGKQSA